MTLPRKASAVSAEMCVDLDYPAYRRRRSLSQDIHMKPELGGDQPGWRRVLLRLSAMAGSWKVDDLYVDPKRRG